MRSPDIDDQLVSEEKVQVAHTLYVKRNVCLEKGVALWKTSLVCRVNVLSMTCSCYFMNKVATRLLLCAVCPYAIITA